MPYVSTQDTIDRLYKFVMDNKSKCHRQPTLTIYTLTDDPATKSYVSSKMKAGEKWGVIVTLISCQGISKSQFRNMLDADCSDAIVVQRPLPKGWTDEDVEVRPTQDVDGLANGTTFWPATALGVYHFILDHLRGSMDGDFNEDDLRHTRVCILGRSKLVGLPLSQLLIQRGFTVDVCHSKTINTHLITRECDVVVSAIGKPHEINEEYFVYGDYKLVVDVGINKVGDKLVGDVSPEVADMDYNDVTPVPKGVGPLTVAFLMYNCWLTMYPDDTEFPEAEIK